MKTTIVAAVILVILGGASGAYGQMTGGGGSGIGSGPPGALPNGGLGATDAPPHNHENTVVPPSAGLRDQSGSGLVGLATGSVANGVNQAQLPPVEGFGTLGGGFRDEDVNGRGAASTSGDGLITTGGAHLE